MVQLVKEEQDTYATDFSALKSLRPENPGWFGELREEAMAAFSKLGFPTVKDEAWRFTNLAPITRLDLGLAADRSEDVLAEHFGELAYTDIPGPRAVFVNGYFAPHLSRLEEASGVSVQSLASTLTKDPEALRPYLGRLATFGEHALCALNTAFTPGGACIRIGPDQAPENPLQVIHLALGNGRPQRIHPRNLVLVGDNAQGVVVESYLALDDESEYLCNPVTEVWVGRNAQLKHYRLQQESRQAFHIGVSQVRLGRDSRYSLLSVDTGSRLARNDLGCVLDGEGAWAALNGLYLLEDKQHLDNYTTLEHAKPHCDSRELFKGILSGQARGVFRGRIIVHKDAQKTDSKQTNNNLLLSDEASVNTKPQLEIYADDVKCTHGATIGQLDDRALFYLRSRGLSQSAARSLLVYAFATELLQKVEIAPLKEALADQLSRWLPQGESIREAYRG